MLLIALALLFAATFGHLLITRASMGVCYTIGVRHRGWHAMLFAHALIGVAGPVLMFVFVGLLGARILRGGDIAGIPLPWASYMTVCIAAVPIGAVVLMLRRRDAIPSIQRSNHTTTRNAVAELGRIPAPADTIGGRLSRIPGNECFRVDFRRLEITVRRLPPALDGLSILHLTDLHFIGAPDRSFFEWATDACAELKPDLIALTGDIADKLSVLDWLPRTLGKLHAPLGRYFVLGNHDIDTGADPISQAMLDIGWTYVGGRFETIEHAGERLLIAGTERPWAGDWPSVDDATLRSSSLRVLLAHLPHEVRWAKRNDFDLALAGHLHGGQIKLPVLGAIVGGRLASGLFDFNPTVLHVGRGLGELAPLRFGCPPEVTTLVLRSAR